MTDKPDRIKVRELVSRVQRGQVDVLEFQRIFHRDQVWVRELIDSLMHGIPLGALLFWEPAADAPPPQGRYRSSSDAQWWIVDGQQRVTAILAALGVRPPWFPDERWAAVGGDKLQVLIGADADGHPVFTDRHRHSTLPLGKLAFAGNSEFLASLRETGFPCDGEFPFEVDGLRRKILDAELLLEWMPGELEDAFLAFKRRNSRSTQLALRPDELELAVLASRFGPLLRDYVDPALADAEARNLGKAFTRRRMNTALQRMLPAGQRKLKAARIDSKVVQEAAERLRRTSALTVQYLHEHGLVHDELLATPAVVDVLLALFDRAEEATGDLFAVGWLAHVVAGNLFYGRPGIHRRTVDAILGAETYDEIKAGIAAEVPAGPPPMVSPKALNATLTRRSNFGTYGSLLALASTTGTARDLATPDIRYPDPRLRLRPLCRKPVGGLLAHHTFMTEHTAQLIADNGGWTRDTYEKLRPEQNTLAAHCLPVPPPELASRDVGAWLRDERTPLLIRRINAFLANIGPLRGQEGSHRMELP